jgi:hypothetical protein
LRVGSGADPFLAAVLGMLLYTTIMNPGYFLAQHELPVVGMFAVLVALTIASLIVVFA